jgi:tungstate transport system substrate-binding protein
MYDCKCDIVLLRSRDRRKARKKYEEGFARMDIGMLNVSRRRRGVGLSVILVLVLVLAVTALATACGSAEETTTTVARPTTTVLPATTAPPTTAAPETMTTIATSDLILASTTSTQDSGLFDVLVPAFNEAFPQYTVKVVAVGSGEAMKLGETGDADVLLVHSPAAEKTFMENGFGVDRKPVMFNDFIVVGPPADPAKIKGTTDASDAFTRIAGAQALFFSRGDDSGTHNKEKAIWKGAGITPEGDWYQVTGQGMGETLTIADQKAGYTLSDRGTYLAKKGALTGLEIVVEGDAALNNPYHVITVKNGTNMQGANDFLNWIVSDEAQKIIEGFGVEKFGQPLFFPNAGAAE